MLVVAVNLRPAIAVVGPVLPEIGADLSLGTTQLAVLTAGPVFCMGLFAPAAARLARRHGLRPAIALALATVAVGLLLRLGPGAPLLFTGTLVAAAGIAVGNVLVPALVRAEHPTRVGLLMGLYTVALAGSASVTSATAVPLAGWAALGWRGPLAAGALLAVLGAVAWSALACGGRGRPPSGPAADGTALVRRPLAWAVTAYFAVQALSFFTILTWLAPILRDNGTDPTTAGLLLSLVTLVQLPASLLVPLVAVRLASQRPLVAGASFVSAAGLLGLVLAPSTAPVVWVVLLGLGQGAGFALALSLIVLRTATGPDTAALSGMAQAVGYTCAGLGPLGAGLLHDAYGTWSVPLLGLLLLLGLQALPGWTAAGHGTLRAAGRSA